MKPFQFTRPESRDAALGSATQQSAYIAGGTNLLDLMKKHIHQPDKLLDVTSALPSTIETTGGGIRIGAMVRNSTLTEDATVIQRFPLIAKAILKGASPQIRNMASVGGNLMQRTRCPYFYDTQLPCNKRAPGSGCGALKGFNRTAAIVGYSESCVAVHPSDLCVALSALDADVEIITKGHTQSTIPFSDFHRLPGNSPERDNTLPDSALITAVSVPDNPYAQYNTYLKLRDRDSYAFALVSVAAAMHIEAGIIRSARLASGGVAHKPWRWYSAEEYLQGKAPTEDHFMRAAEIAIRDVKPLEHNAFKVPMLKGAILTALNQCMNA